MYLSQAMSAHREWYTFRASDSHDRLKANLPDQVSAEIHLELLHEVRGANHMVGWVVVTAATRILADTPWKQKSP